jgi:tetratricopeptide (TPR) repeat protein
MNSALRATTLSLLLATGGAAAHTHDAPPARVVLGALQFPTASKSPEAQAAFIEGMLYLHLFEYTSAAQAFQRAQAQDPGFAMAYWGEAMSYTHPVWNQQDMEAGRAALARLAPTPEARAAKAGSAREREFLATVEGLYGEGEKKARDLQLLAAMEAMAKRYPEDDEVQLFLALALLGADEGKRDLPRFLRAAEISKSVYRRNPKHPGAAHYWIHGMDDPQHAAGALEAAHALSKIAPDAGHSQHMTSHIFIALGRWQDVVDANIAALKVGNDELSAKSQPAWRCGHYSEWLQYAYLQQGKEDQAWAMVGECQRSIGPAVTWLRAHPGEAYLSARKADTLETNALGSLGRMQAAALVDARKFSSESLADSGSAAAIAHGGAGLLLARGLAQLRGGDKTAASSSLSALRALADAPAAAGEDERERVYTRIMARMLAGATDATSGRATEGVGTLEQAAADYDAQPFDFGPPATVKPPRELLGEVLLAAGHREEAQAQFEHALRAAPQRRLSLDGRAKAGAAPASN